jgi:beta-lactamase regulating signal transducer with metallopeptidase domain
MDFYLLSASFLFVLAISAAAYLLSWLIVSIYLRIFPASAARRKKSLFAALISPFIITILLVVGGVYEVLARMDRGANLMPLCSSVDGMLLSPTMNLPPAFKIVGLIALWLLISLMFLFSFRLISSTFLLTRELKPFLTKPSVRLSAAIIRLQQFLPVRNNFFFECPIPMHYSSIIGLMKPRCVLSEEMVKSASDDELLSVIAHEAYHLHHRDTWMSAVIAMVNTSFFYLRPVRMMTIQCREAMELTCDEAVIKATGQPLELASALLRSCRMPAVPNNAHISPAFADGNASQVEHRIERLLELAGNVPSLEKPQKYGYFQWTITLLLAISGGVALSSTQALCVSHCSLLILRHALH